MFGCYGDCFRGSRQVRKEFVVHAQEPLEIYRLNATVHSEYNLGIQKKSNDILKRVVGSDSNLHFPVFVRKMFPKLALSNAAEIS